MSGTGPGGGGGGEREVKQTMIRKNRDKCIHADRHTLFNTPNTHTL